MRVYTQTYFLTSQNINKDKMRLKFLLGHEKKNHERGWGMGAVIFSTIKINE